MATAKCALSACRRRKVNGPMGYKRVREKASVGYSEPASVYFGRLRRYVRT